MQDIKIDKFHLIGISTRTSNQNQQAARDIPELWNRFHTEQVLENIPNKIDSTVYSVYTNYEGDHMLPYDIILGCKVSSLDQVPEGMTAHTFEGGNYKKFLAKGNLAQGAVYNAWLKIWESDINRAYTADFECYGEKAMNPENAEVDIFIATN